MFDPHAAAATVRSGKLPSGWEVFPLRATSVIMRMALGLLTFAGFAALTAWFITNGQAFVPGFIDNQTLAVATVNGIFYGECAVFTVFALLGVVRMVRAIIVAARLRDHFLLLTPEGLALSAGGRVRGMAFASIQDMREASNALMIAGPGRESLTLRGAGYGDPEEIYSQVMAGARAQRGRR